MGEALDRPASSRSMGLVSLSGSSGPLDPTLPRPSGRQLGERVLASFPRRLLHPGIEVRNNLSLLAFLLTLCVQTQLKSFPFLIDAAIKWMSGPVSRQSGEVRCWIPLPSHAQCLSPFVTIQAVSGSSASLAESNQVR